jgi:hypothetical protein
MNRLTLLLSLLVVAGAARAEFDPRDWRYVQGLACPKAAGYQALVLPPEVYARCVSRSLTDLRIISSARREVPYVLLRPADLQPAKEQVALPLRNLSRVPGVGVRFEVARDPGAALLRALTFSTPATNFCHRVRIEGSDDGRQWATLRADGTIFRFRGDTKAEGLRVSFPPTDHAFLRVTVLTRGAPFVVAAVTAEAESPAAWPPQRLYTSPMSVHWYPETKTTEITVDLGQSWQPVDEVEVDFQDVNVMRRCDLKYSNAPGENWSYGPSGQALLRYRTRTYAGEHRRLQAGVTTRFLCVVVHNGDDAPLQISGLRAYARPSLLVFKWQPRENMRLYYGCDEAPPPRYDLGEYLRREYPREVQGQRRWPTDVKTGDCRQNPDYPWKGKPWTERAPWLIYLALAVGVAFLGLILWRTMRRVDEGEPGAETDPEQVPPA